MEQIEQEIWMYEHKGNTDYDTCERLAVLYAVRDNYRPDNPGYSAAPAPAPAMERVAVPDDVSDFLRAVKGKNSAQAWAVIDELMDTLAVVNGRVYRKVMDKIMDL